MKFKVGDKVRCVDSGVGGLTYGSEYLVQKVTHNFVYLENDYGNRGGYLHSRFELVVEEKPKRYISFDAWGDFLSIVDRIDLIPSQAEVVYELGDELVKRVAWEKKDA